MLDKAHWAKASRDKVIISLIATCWLGLFFTPATNSQDSWVNWSSVIFWARKSLCQQISWFYIQIWGLEGRLPIMSANWRRYLWTLSPHWMSLETVWPGSQGRTWKMMQPSIFEVGIQLLVWCLNGFRIGANYCKLVDILFLVKYSLKK